MVPSSHVMHRRPDKAIPFAVSASGLTIKLADGREILDASSGPAVSCIGHCHPQVIAAMQDQMARLDYVHTGAYTNQPAEDLARYLVETSKGAFSKVVYVSSGTEAIEASLKLARQYHVERGEPQRTHVISRRLSYHGASLGALSVGGHVARRRIYEELLPSNFDKVSPCYAYRFRHLGETDEDYATRLAEELETEILRIGTDKVMAFFAETIVGAATGCVPAVPGYFKKIREVCDKYGVLLVLDEVMSGIGRSGTLHAFEGEGITPDIQAVAKGLAAGYMPLGAVLVSPKVSNAVMTGSGFLNHGQTFQAHPLACRAALEVQHIIRDEDLLSNVQTMGDRLSSSLKSALSDHPHIGDIRGRGLFWGIEFVADKETKDPFPPEKRLSELVGNAAFENGVAIYPGSGTADGLLGDHVIISPPFNITEAEMADIADRIVASVRQAL